MTEILNWKPQPDRDVSLHLKPGSFVLGGTATEPSGATATGAWGHREVPDLGTEPCGEPMGRALPLIHTCWAPDSPLLTEI